MTAPIKIGINTLYLIPGKGGGLETVVRNLLASLRKIDGRNDYLLFTNREGAGKFDAGGNVREVPCPVSASFRPGKHAWEQVVFPFWLKRHRVDVLFSPGNVTPLCSPCPSVTVINDAIPFIRPEHFSLAERIVLKGLSRISALRSAAVLTLSESAKRDIVRHLRVPHGRVAVFPLAAEERFRPVTDCDRMRTRYGIRTPYLICLASSRPYKNIDGLVRAFTLLKQQRGIPHQLVIAGLAGRAHDALQDLSAPLLASKDILFTGFVPDEDLPALYSCATASVYPSLYEGFGLPVIESMACGTPVISSNAASLPEVVGGAGVLFDPLNREEMSAAIHSVISNDVLRRSLREKGFQRAGQFSWDRSARIILDHLLEHARPASR